MKQSYVYYQLLLQELYHYKLNGISLKLDGRDATPEEIAYAITMKKTPKYMRDYVTSKDQKHLLELHFNAIFDN